MVEVTCQALKRVLAVQNQNECVEIDGYSNFLFLNRNGYPKTACDFNSILRNLIKKYNKCHEENCHISHRIHLGIHSAPTVPMPV